MREALALLAVEVFVFGGAGLTCFVSVRRDRR